MKASAGCPKDLRGVLARWARVPLEHREAVLVMHEGTDRIDEGALPAGLGLRKTRHRKHNVHWLGKGFAACAARIVDGGRRTSPPGGVGR